MARFWLATFELNPAPAEAWPTPRPPPAGGWAIEVIEEEGEWAVLLSTVDDRAKPSRLECLVGFANDCERCDLWHGRGFPLQDAEITFKDGVLRVWAAGFLATPVINYRVELVTIDRAMVLYSGEAKSAPEAELDVTYSQAQRAPDFAAPATRVREKPVSWRAPRQDIRELTPVKLTIGLAAARLPSLAKFPAGSQVPTAAWTGTLRLPSRPRPAQRKQRGQAVRSVDRDEYFVGSAFRFEEVEVIGFRIDLDRHGIGAVEETSEEPDHLRRERVDDILEEMIEPLNFHRERGPIAHFRYRPATRTVSLELLRYGRMRLKKDWRQITVEDFQSQHELLIRMLVGRVDDDTGQAHDPATFVPVLFVDNPWSKALGRDVQGFNKRLADFCTLEGDTPQALSPDGRPRKDPAAKPVPLTRIEEVRLTRSTGPDLSDLKILELDYPFHDDGNDDDDDFDEIDLGLALGMSSFAPTRWRQSDFGDLEFRRSFARQAIPKTLAGIRSVQVSPIGEPLFRKVQRSETTWINGNLALDGGARIARPNGTVGLTLWAEPSAPSQWRTFCSLLGIQEKARFSFPAGSWYRLRCSMDLDIDNAFG